MRAMRVRAALRRLADQSAWAYLAFICVLSGVAFMLDPDRLAPRTIYDGLPYWLVLTWTGSVAFGGLAILTGLTGGWPRIERLGYLYLAIAVAIFGACLTFIGWTPNRMFSLINYAAAFIALVARYRFLGRKFEITVPKRLTDDAS